MNVPAIAPPVEDDLLERIEDWVVSTVDDKAGPASEPIWAESAEGFSLVKRTGRLAKPGGSPSPTTAREWSRFSLSRRRGVAVATLADASLVREDDVEELCGDLLALSGAGHLRIVVDFSNVERITSWAADAISRAASGCLGPEASALKFVGLSADVASMFAMTGLDPRVQVGGDVVSAITGLWPDAPGLRPLPVPILAALMRAEAARPGPSESELAMNGARLIVQDGPSMGKSVAILGSKFVIGRGADCQLRVASATASRAHALIERRGGRLYLRDLMSTNGTVLNGRALRGRESLLLDGDTIRVGPLTFTLAVDAEVDLTALPPSPPPAPTAVRHTLAGPASDSDAEFEVEVEGDAGSTAEYPLPGNLGDRSNIKTEVIEGVLVVTPLASGLDEPGEVDALRDALFAMAGWKGMPTRVVLDLTHVGRISGRAIGVVVAHHLRLDRVGGALRICSASPRVALLLEQVRIGMLVQYHANLEDAVIRAWPEPAPARG